MMGIIKTKSKKPAFDSEGWLFTEVIFVIPAIVFIASSLRRNHFIGIPFISKVRVNDSSFKC